MKKGLLTTLFFSIFFTLSFSQSKNWKSVDIEKSNFSEDSLKFRKSIPTNFKVYELNLKKFKKEISLAKTNELTIIELPTANGIQKFSVSEASSLAKGLALKHPLIKSYLAKGIDDLSATARFSFGTDGFHGVIFYTNQTSFYIDPYTKNYSTYISYSRSSLPQKDNDFKCEVDEQVKEITKTSLIYRTADDGLLRTYRLALVCSGEYAQFHLNNQGISSTASDVEKKEAVLSAMNTSMTRINGVYERDLGVRMEIVEDNEQVIFLDASTDGITDGSAGTMISQVQNICDTTIGDANYDIGHIFSIGGSGLASLGVVCNSGSKARGVTGISTPLGDPYDIDYVSHEMGHQFGAYHTQNNSCNRNPSTAVEPGSASTIMGYAGICPPNVQSNSDDHFHSVSIAEMWNRIETTASCASTTSTGNSAPVITEGSDYSIPKSTPFVLRGIASDIDSEDVLSYNWEQIDNEIATMPPSSTSTVGPAFRSNSSISSPNRYMPALPTVIGGNISSTWEVVPSVAREMNFSLMVRDNAAGGGNTARDDIKVTTLDITPFTVDGPSTNEEWFVGSNQTITWVVGASNQAPVNSQNVTILLSTDGGVSFPIVLLESTTNNGSATVVVPNNVTSTARIMVAATDNIFYNVNSSDFTINFSDPTFIATNTTGVVEVCNSNTNDVTYDIYLDFINDFSETVSFSAAGEPSGSSVTFSPSTINSEGNVTMTLSNLNGAAVNTYQIDITASSNSITRNLGATLDIIGDTFASLNLTSPNNTETGVGLSPVFTWEEISNASSYDIEIAADQQFSSILFSENVITNSYSGATLNQSTTYYWRVKAKNSCGDGDFSPANSFITLTCTVCSSSGITNLNTSITKVIFNTIDNSSGKSGYSDYTDISTSVKADEVHDLTIRLNTDGRYTNRAKVWIDWNQNCDFNDEGEEYDLGSAFNVSDGLTSESPLSITVPTDAVIGTTTMRVSSNYVGYAESCESGFDGEVEDYSIEVIDATASLDNDIFDGFNLYPNPSNGNFNLQFNAESTESVEIQLYDLTGRLVKELQFSNISLRFSESISFQNTAKGFYVLKIKNGAKQTSRKLVIE
ncbi:M12 family metallo-peptidase [Flavobacteriaceae bacterium]|nr:M12 family metallo-peptidase [Flavobacteriaceae bacterium]